VSDGRLSVGNPPAACGRLLVLFAKSFELEGVHVTWGKALRERLGQPGPYTREGIELLAAALEKKLKPAT
jgi:hypothetical protein